MITTTTRRHFQHRQRKLRALALQRAADVDRGQHDDHDEGVDRGTVAAERDQHIGVVAIDEGDRGDRAGLDHGAARPGEQQSGRRAVGAGEEMILAAGIGMRSAEFGVAKRADQSEEAAEHPKPEKNGLAARSGRDDRGRLEDADAQNEADNDGRTLNDRDVRLRALEL